MVESCRLVTTEQYKEYQLLKKKLDIAVKALKEFKKNEDSYLDFGLTSYGEEIKLNPNRIATKALKEIEEVK